MVLDVHGHAVAVVHAGEDDRQLPDRGQVERFVKRALVGGAVPEEAHHHPVDPLQ